MPYVSVPWSEPEPEWSPSRTSGGTSLCRLFQRRDLFFRQGHNGLVLKGVHHVLERGMAEPEAGLGRDVFHRGFDDGV